MGDQLNTTANYQQVDSTNELIYVVEGMSRGHCRTAIAQQVAQVEGVVSVDVNLDRGLVTVGGERRSDIAVRAAVKDGGYDAVAR